MERAAMNFAIDCQWLDYEAATAEDETLCHLAISADDAVLTRNVSVETDKEEDAVVVSAWPLAAWLAGNWWRLLHETGPGAGLAQYPPSLDWRKAHEMAAADYGYLWPEVTLVSDEESIRFRIVDTQAERIQLARYVYPADFFVNAEAFGNGVMAFLKAVAARLANRFEDDPLRELVAQILGEIKDPGFALYRKTEAMLGYDPDMAPEELVRHALNTIERFGENFFRDMASAININFSGDGNPQDRLKEISKAASHVADHGTDAVFVLAGEFAAQKTHAAPPWEHGRKLARELRKFAGLSPDAKLTTHALTEWFDMSENVMSRLRSYGEFGICKKMDTRLKIGFASESGSHCSDSRRFFLARMTGACLMAEKNGWLAITPGATWDQKMQRAFAAELIAPIAAIRDALSSRQPDRRDIEKIANHFGASLFTVVHSLANNRDISPRRAQALLAD